MSQLSNKHFLLRVFVFIFLTTSCGLFAQGSSELKSIKIGNDQRKYRLFTPSSYSADNDYPLILNFHGTNGHPDKQVVLSEFEKLAEIENFIVVSPLALFKRKIDGPITWNVNLKKGPDDVLFIRQLIATLKLQLSIEETHVFATGFSGGARMSSRLACDLSATVAAIGPVAGIRYPQDCKPSRGVPTITFHGENDMVNHYTLRSDSPVYWQMGVEDALAGWVKNNQCQSMNQTQHSLSVEFVQYKNCKNNADIDFYRSSEAGHTWPGSPMAEKLSGYGLGKTEQDLPASRLIWEFFKLHPLPK